MANLLNLLPLVFQVLGFFLKWYGASDDVMKKFLALVDSSYDAGLIPIKSRDKFTDQKQRIEQKIKDQEANKPK